MPNFSTIKKNGLTAALLTAAAALAAAQIFRAGDQGTAIFSYAGRGWELLYGIRDAMIGFSMPLLSVLFTFIDYEPRRLALAVDAALLLLFFSAYNLGRIKGDRLHGALYAVSAGLIGLVRPAPHGPEQIFFTLLLVVYLNLEAARAARPGPGGSFLSGLALGATLLVRSSLFLFPPVAAALELLFAVRPRKTVLKEAAFFLLGAYILLVPWVRLNYFVSGRFIPLENERGTANLITGVKGAIFTMEGDSRALAGLSREDSVFKWAVSEVLREPGAYFSAVAKRIWFVLKMFPFTFLLAALALFYLRRKADPFLIALAAYFLIIHCLLSIEERYFYPLSYLLGFLIAGAAGAVLSRGREEPGDGARAAYAVFAPLFIFILAVESLVLAYPYRAGADHLTSLEAALKKRPGHSWLLMTRAETLIRDKRTEEGLAVLRTAVGSAGGKKYSDSGEVLRLMDAAEPAGMRVEFSADYAAPLFTALRELELGRKKEAGDSLAEAYSKWNMSSNMLRGTPYERDSAILKELRLNNAAFQDRFIFDALLYWPPERRSVILDRLGGILPPTARLAFLKFLSMPLKNEKDAAAFSALARRSGVIAQAAPSDYGIAARQMIKALLPVRTAGAGGGPAGTALALLENRESGAELTMSSFGAMPAGKEEMDGLAALISGGGRGAAEKLFALRPENPLYFALNLKTLGAGGTAFALEGFRTRPGFLLDAAAIYAARGGKDKAALLANAALGSPRPDTSLIRRAALILQSAGRYREALTAINRAIVGSGDWHLLNDRGVIHMFLGDRQAAEKDLLSALALEPASWEARLNLAAIRLGAGRRDEAAALYRELLNSPDLPDGAKTFVSTELANLPPPGK